MDITYSDGGNVGRQAYAEREVLGVSGRRLCDMQQEGRLCGGGYHGPEYFWSGQVEIVLYTETVVYIWEHCVRAGGFT